MGKQWSIYTLTDPRDNSVRYVGVTHQKLARRLSEHLSVAKTKKQHDHRSCWLRKLISEGLTPLASILEQGEGDGWAACEIKWIAHYRGEGCKLVNATEGGEGTIGWSPNREQRERISKWMKGRDLGKKHTDETRANMSKSQKEHIEYLRSNGLPMPGSFERSPETLAKMRLAQVGRKTSPETRQKMREIHSNPPAELREKWRQATLSRPKEQRDAWARNRKGCKETPEHRANQSLAAKRRYAEARSKKGFKTPNDQEVKEIREKYAKGSTSYRKLTAEYQTTRDVIVEIIKGPRNMDQSDV